MKTLMNAQQTADFLGVTLSAVRTWTAAGQLPRIKIGRLVRYDLAKMEEWLEKQSADAQVSMRKSERHVRHKLGRRDPEQPATFTLD